VYHTYIVNKKRFPMSHEVETMAYAGEVPWHGLGFPVSNDLTVDEMMEAAKLNWDVGKFDTYCDVPVFDAARPSLLKTERVPTGFQSLVRLSDNKILSEKVSKTWEPVQNREAFEFFREFVDAGDMEMHTAGSLKGGEVVWVLAKVGESFKAVKGDTVESFFLLSASHRYGRSTVAKFSPIRVVCWNTLSFALSRRGQTDVIMNHREKFQPQRVKELMGIARDQFKTYEEKAQLLASVKADPELTVEYFDRLFPVSGENRSGKKHSKNAELCIDALTSQPGIQFAPDTWWQNLNSTTYVIDHLLSRDVDTRLFNSWLDNLGDKKIEAMNEAVAYAMAA